LPKNEKAKKYLVISPHKLKKINKKNYAVSNCSKVFNSYKNFFNVAKN